MNPSNFLKHPYDSIFHHIETEIVARNIMVILWRTGDEWRKLSWEEYVDERQKDGGFTPLEYKEFEAVKSYCWSEDEAKKFSPVWSHK